VRQKRDRTEDKPRPARGAKRARTEDDAGAEAAVEAAAPAPAAAPAAVPAHVLPSRTLLVQGLPTNLTSETLDALLKKLFGQFACVRRRARALPRGETTTHLPSRRPLPDTTHTPAVSPPFSGLNSVRSVPQRGLAFVEFTSELAAAPALQNLNNFRLSDEASLSVSFAR
jgi:RNA recognition motif-containing protein